MRGGRFEEERIVRVPRRKHSSRGANFHNCLSCLRESAPASLETPLTHPSALREKVEQRRDSGRQRAALADVNGVEGFPVAGV